MAREALKERKTLAELAAEYDVHPKEISQWKRQLLDALPEVFSKRRESDRKAEEALKDRLYPLQSRLALSLASRKPCVHAVKRCIIIYRLWFSSGKSGLSGNAGGVAA
ncbi:MAG: hypothetical protein J7M19_02040 [Planctomycetes bacterium]|nr:hypothetical protein [Planctomycetota bacterium]